MSKHMSERTLRRAAEHAARKAAAKQAKLQQQTNQAQAVAANPEAVPEAQAQTMSAAAGAAAPSIPNVDFGNESNEPETPRTISDAQLNANRANAQKSTGPVTEAGRTRSSLNAVKTGLTGATVLLPTDDAKAYQAHLDRHFKQYEPATDEERELVQMIADSKWRILRIPGLEASLYAVARLRMADVHPEITDPAVRESIIDGEIQLTYRRDLSNLALQERRLRNQHKSDLEKLQALQDERSSKTQRQKLQTRMMHAIRLMRHFSEFPGVFDPAANGFEFSLDEIEFCSEALRRSQIRAESLLPFADLLFNDRRMQQTQKMAA